MNTSSPQDVTGLLRAWSRGDPRAAEQLIPLVYEDLRRRAGRQLRRERGMTLRTTGLVHEAYLRLANERAVTWRNRAQFFAVAARVMRRVLVDRARARAADKRAAGWRRVTLDEELVAAAPPSTVDIVDLDRALDELEALDRAKARVIELRFFAGLGVEETAETMGVSTSTVVREWRLARAWLYRRLAEDAGRAGRPRAGVRTPPGPAARRGR